MEDNDEEGNLQAWVIGKFDQEEVYNFCPILHPDYWRSLDASGPWEQDEKNNKKQIEKCKICVESTEL